MKTLFLLLALASSSFPARASDAIQQSVALQAADSELLHASLVVLGQTSETDPQNPAITWQKTGFHSSDGAFAIACVHTIFSSLDQGTSCQVQVDSSASKPGVSAVKAGAVGDVVVVTLSAPSDVDSLKRSVVKALGYFQSTEKVAVVMPNGHKGLFDRLRVDCVSFGDDCQVTLFPRHQ
jgi:hypothetical protein